MDSRAVPWEETRAGELRDSGLPVIGSVPWGTHFCQFYHTKEDLLDILVPYFAAGLRSGDYCMWVTAEPANKDDAIAAMKEALPAFPDAVRQGQIEVIPYHEWYTTGAGFDSERVLAGWVARLGEALDKGFAGLRLTGNTFWLERNGWKAFADYEEEVNRVIGRYRMIALCTYSLDRCGAHEILDVVGNHQFALIKRGGAWVRIESAEQIKREAELRRLNRTLRALSNSNQAMMRAGTEPEYLQKVCRLIVEDCGHAMAWIGMAEEDEAKSVRPVAWAGFEEGYLATLGITWADTERGRGPTGTAIRTGKPSLCRNMLTDPAFAPWRAEALKRGYASSIVLPLLAEGKAFGAVSIYSREPDPFTEEEVRLLAELADDLSFGIRTLRLRKSSAKAAEALESANRELGDLARTLEVRVDERTAELLAANKELRQRADQLRRLARDLALTEHRERQRIATLLHDHLQQLLAAARFRASTIAGDADPKTREAIAALDKLLGETLDASRSLTCELSPPILREGGLGDALAWLARWMGETHGLEVRLQTEKGAFGLSEETMLLLFQSVRELLFNVVKHAGVHSARVSAARIGDRIEVTVSDEGAGFDPTRLCAEGNSSTRFGLFSIKERLALLGGEVRMESAPKRGSRFTLSVPIPGAAHLAEVDAGREAAPASPGSKASPPAGPRIRILLADDHRVLREGLAQVLTMEPDIEIVGEAADGEAAVALALKLRPDVVVMDVSMPRLSGVEATRRIRAKEPGIGVIGLSMYEEDERAEAMRSAGAASYVTKSAPAERLLAAIRDCAARLRPPS